MALAEEGPIPRSSRADMGHPHDHDHDDHHHAGGAHSHAHGGLPTGRRIGADRRDELRRLQLTMAISVLAMIAEAVGGFLGHSLALLSDAGHMLADVGAIGLSVLAIRIGARPADLRRTYGYYRLEILAALVNGAALLAIAFGIAVEALQRFRHPHPMDVRLVTGLALMGIALNGAGLWLTHGGSESSSMSLRSTFLHLAGDLLNSVGVLIAAGVLALTGWSAVDPAVSLLIAAGIVWGAIRLCRDAVDVLLEGVPRHLDFGLVQQALGGLGGVQAVHDLHVWTITSGMVALSCHIVVACDGPGCRSHDDILAEARAVLKDRFAIEHTTIQFESPSFQHTDVVH